MNMRPILSAAAVSFAFVLCSCAGSGDDGSYSGRRHGGYYSEPSLFGQPGQSGQDYEERRRRVEANCNMGWSNCANVCNTIADANQRYVCVANCNVTLNNCLSHGR